MTATGVCGSVICVTVAPLCPPPSFAAPELSSAVPPPAAAAAVVPMAGGGGGGMDGGRAPRPDKRAAGEGPVVSGVLAAEAT